VVTHAFIDASDLQQPAGLQRVVLKPIQSVNHIESVAEHLCDSKAAKYFEAIPLKTSEKRRREAAAREG
jgi:hypothetical protein